MRRARWGWCGTSVLLAALPLAACAPAPDADILPVEFATAQFVERGEVTRWLRASSRPYGLEQLLPRPGDRIEWQTVTFPRVYRAALAPDGNVRFVVHWFRFVYTPPGEGFELGLYLPRFFPISPGWIDIFVNGRQVDLPASRVDSFWNQPLMARIPPELHRGAEPLEILIAVTFDGRGGYGLAPLSVGPAEILERRADIRRYFQLSLPETLSYAFLALGLFSLGVWARRREVTYLLFGAATLVWWLRTTHYYITVVPIGTLPYWWIVVNSMSWLMLLVYLFAMRFQGRRSRWAERWLWALVIGGGAFAIGGWYFLPALASTGVYIVQLVVATGVTTLITLDARRLATRESLVLATALWVCLFMGAYDILLKDSHVDPRGIFLMPYGSIFLFGAFLYMVLRRYTGAIEDVERLNASLETRLAERTRELEASYQKLRAIERDQTLLAERQRLMREMHDGLGSSLMSSLVMVQQGRLGNEQVATVLRECIDDLKLTIDSLEPIGADLVTLLATLRYRLGQRLEGAGLKLEWRVDDLPRLEWLDALAALQVLRILQEALTNVIKHSGATAVTVETEAAGGEVRVRVVDNGRGFDVGRAREAGSGRGLLNLRRRAEQIGGRVDIESGPQGTRVQLSLPIHQPVAPPSAVPAG